MNKTAIKRLMSTAILAIVLAAVILMIACVFIYRGDLVGWCLMPLGIGSLVAGVLGLRDNHPRFVISDSGVIIRAVGSEEIPWKRVKSVRLEWLPRAGEAIILILVNGEKHRINASGLDQTPEAILNLLKAHVEHNKA